MRLWYLSRWPTVKAHGILLLTALVSRDDINARSFQSRGCSQTKNKEEEEGSGK